MDQLFRHRRGGQLKRVGLGLDPVQPPPQRAIFLAPGRVLPINPLLEMRNSLGADLGPDGARFDQDHINPGASHFKPQDIRQTFQREFGRDIGPAPFGTDQPQHRGAIDNPPMALRAHCRDHAARQVVIAKKVGFINLAQRPARQVTAASMLASSA